MAFQHQQNIADYNTTSFPSNGRKEQSSSPEPTSNGAAKNTQKHRRNYQACEPCRERKVKCDMGNVDNPDDPPCKKCAREKKECWFSDIRKKAKEETKVRDNSLPEGRPAKRARSNGSEVKPNLGPLMSPTAASFGPASNPLSPTGMLPPTSPSTSLSGMRHPSMGSYTSSPAANMRPTNGNYAGASGIYTPPISSVQPPFSPIQQMPPRSNGNDADEHLAAPQIGLAKPFTNTAEGLQALVNAACGPTDSSSELRRVRTANLAGAPTEPDFKRMSPREKESYKKAVQVWKQLKFIKAGWFTANEAIEMVQYFYTKLAPMTPIVTKDFSKPSTHYTLLTEEPVLALTILAISSRYFAFRTPGGQARNYYIHGQLWDSLRKMIQRLLWGQEQFGGGFCGAGMTPTREIVTGQVTWKGSLRTLGTVEALLLLTDWQPRALHFPPGEDENKLLASDDMFEDDNQQANMSNFDNIPYSTWLEPAWRSDRMSWMLLGLAQSLGFELGVFDRKEGCHLQHTTDSECVQQRRIRRLLVTYVSQISGRIGITSSLMKEADFDSCDMVNEKTEVTQKLWFDIAMLMGEANRTVFSSGTHTARLIQGTGYKSEINRFKPMLQEWWGQFSRVKQHLDEPMQHVLRMEYEYARLYINSLGMQKVVEQMVVQNVGHVGHRGSSEKLSLVYHENRDYINEVRHASTSILDAVDRMAGLGCLRDAPVRTFLRSLSGMMFTLKLFSVGNTAQSVRNTLRTLGKVTTCLEQNVVDDVHMAPGTARLIRQLMDDVKRSMIRVPKPGSRDQSRQLSPIPGVMANGLHENESPDPISDVPFANVMNQSFMPPPGFDVDAMFDTGMGGFGTMDNSIMGMEDWITMPFDNLVPSGQATVNQGFGGIGPTIGDRDMLSLMTGSQLDQNFSGVPQYNNNFGNGF